MKAVLDAGAFVALEKRDRGVGAMLRVLQRRRISVSTSAAVVAQIWRDGTRQALTARVLDGVDIRSLDGRDGKRTGQLLGASRSSDVVDAHLALVIDDGDRVLTSDPKDIERLLRALAVDAQVVRV